MKYMLMCPRCKTVARYAEGCFRGFYILCKGCGVCSPLRSYQSIGMEPGFKCNAPNCTQDSPIACRECRAGIRSGYTEKIPFGAKVTKQNKVN